MKCYICGAEDLSSSMWTLCMDDHGDTLTDALNIVMAAEDHLR